jgi:hypothetical protein
MIVGVPAELVASPLRNSREPGEADRSALVIGGTGKIRTGGATVFLKVVAVTQAVVARDGQVRAEGRPYDHARLGPLEDWLDAQAGPGVIDGIADRAVLDTRYVKGKYRRLLTAAFMIRVIVLWTLMPDARMTDVIMALAGDLALIPWARQWRPASERSCLDWRRALGPAPLEELRDTVLAAVGRIRDRAAGGQGAAARRRARHRGDAPLRQSGADRAGNRGLGRLHRDDQGRHPRRRPRRRPR